MIIVTITQCIITTTTTGTSITGTIVSILMQVVASAVEGVMAVLWTTIHVAELLLVVMVTVVMVIIVHVEGVMVILLNVIIVLIVTTFLVAMVTVGIVTGCDMVVHTVVIIIALQSQSSCPINSPVLLM